MIRLVSTPSTFEVSTVLFGFAVIWPKFTPLVSRRFVIFPPELFASAIAAARIASRSAVISRASISIAPEPFMPSVLRSFENSAETESVTGSRFCASTNTLATNPPAPPIVGWLWQSAQDVESVPEVRMKPGSCKGSRLVGAPLPVAAGRPWPSSLVQRAAKMDSPISSNSLNSIAPFSMSA